MIPTDVNFVLERSSNAIATCACSYMYMMLLYLVSSFSFLWSVGSSLGLAMPVLNYMCTVLSLGSVFATVAHSQTSGMMYQRTGLYCVQMKSWKAVFALFS